MVQQGNLINPCGAAGDILETGIEYQVLSLKLSGKQQQESSDESGLAQMLRGQEAEWLG
jgi:hypothetical protein